MAFTKITAAGIGSTETVTLDGVAVINNESIGGNLTVTGNATIGGVLTYEDVTNVDSVGLITARNGVVVGSGITLSKDGDIFATGVTTSTTFSGSGANLTNLPAANITGTLPAISGANLTNLDASDLASGTIPDARFPATLPAVSGANLTGIGGTDFIHAEQISVSGVTTSQAFIPSQGQLSHRNIVINGAMQVAQRATSSTSTGYQTVDRFSIDSSGLDESFTQAQGDVASGTTPYTLGFRKTLSITNGNQTGGAGASDYSNIQYKFEAQDLATSGWNYLSSSSFITLSFWVKSSVAQTFHTYLRTKDSTDYHYPFSYALSANTWTKVTKTIPGNSNLTINNDNGEGMQITFMLFYGTSFTDSGATLNAWQATSSGNAYSPDNTSTWYTTNDATFEITGLQLEVGPVATPFEHLSFADDLRRCERYFEVDKMNSGTGGYYAWANSQTGNTRYHNQYFFRAMKRSSPTITIKGTAHGVTPTMFHSSTHIHMYHQSSSFYFTTNHENYVFVADSEL